MTRLIFSVFFILFTLFSCTNEGETVNQVDESGNKIGVWIELNAKGDTIKYEVYDNQSNPMVQESKLKNGGRIKRIYEDGIMRKLIMYYESGQVESETEYLGDVQQGKQIIYFENGDTSILSYYSNNQPVGKYIKFFPNGKVNIKSDSIGNGRFWMYDSLGYLQKIYLQKDFRVIDSLDVSVYQ